MIYVFFFQAEDGIRDLTVTGVQTCALPIYAVFPAGRADVLKHHVHATFVGDAAHLVANFLCFVIDEVVGTEFSCFGELFLGTSSGDDAGTKELRDLNGGAAHAAACTKDENIFPGLQLATSDEHVPGGLKDERNRGGLFPLEIFGISEAVHFGRANEFRRAAVKDRKSVV